VNSIKVIPGDHKSHLVMDRRMSMFRSTGAMLFTNILWSSELEQQLKATLHLRNNFICHLALPPENMAMTPDRHHHTIALESASKRCTPPRLIVGPSILKVKDTLHRMNMSDKRNIIDDANALPFTIWLDELGGIHWEEHWAYSHESFTVSYEMHVWITWQFHEGWWPHILEGYVLTGGKFMTDWQSWWVLARCVQLMREQFSRESRRWMIG